MPLNRHLQKFLDADSLPTATYEPEYFWPLN